MKIGIISDIHGNIQALDAVLKELKDVDKIICLGDFIGGAPSSEEVIQKIILIENKLIAVIGNRERYILEGLPEVVHDEKNKVSPEQFARHEWLKKQLSKSSVNFINKLPKEMRYSIEGKNIYFCHYPMKKDGSFREHIKEATSMQNEKMFEGIEADIYMYGHTHEKIFNKINNKVYINPGALGCPGKTNYAPYGILKIENGNIEYEQKQAIYDAQKVRDDINNIQFPGYKSVLRLFYGII